MYLKNTNWMIKGTKIRLSHLTAAEKLEEWPLKQLALKMADTSQEARCCETGHYEASNSHRRDVCGPVLTSTLPIWGLDF